MEPTLWGRELLEVEPYGEKRARVGDVVLFRARPGDYLVVHRVIRIGADGVRTRGDNNRLEDAGRLGPDDILGQVVAAWRGQQRCVIHGGVAGRLIGAWRRSTRSALRFAGRWLGPLYRSLGRSGMFQRLLPARWQPRVVALEFHGVPVRRLFMGSRIAGEYDSGAGEWRIRRPFRLLVDEKRLPRAASTLPDSKHTTQS